MVALQRPSVPWLAALLAAVLVLAFPVWTVLVPPMPDYPTHVARLHVLAGLLAGDPVLAALYRSAWGPIPNLAMDLLGLPLFWLLPAWDAGRVFLTLTLAMWVIGPAALHWALYRRLGPAPLLAAFFAYNANFFWGFVNYDFAAGTVPLLLAAWLLSEGWTAPRRLAALTALATSLYLAHLMAFAAFALALAGCQLAEAREQLGAGQRRRALLGLVGPAACLLPGAALFLLAKPHNPGETSWEQLHHLATLWTRWLAAVWSRYERPDRYTLFALILLAALLLAGRMARLDRRILAGLVLLAAATMLLPEVGLGGWGAHLRLPALVGALVFAGLELRLSRRLGAALGALALLWLGVNSVHVAQAWQVQGRQIAEARAALASGVPRGSRLLLALNRTGHNHRDEFYEHLGELAVVDRNAFSPLLYAIPGQQVIRPADALRAQAPDRLEGYGGVDAARLRELEAPGIATPPDLTFWAYVRGWPCRFDRLLVIGPERGNPDPDRLEPLTRGSFFTLYGIRPAAACGG